MSERVVMSCCLDAHLLYLPGCWPIFYQPTKHLTIYMYIHMYWMAQSHNQNIHFNASLEFLCLPMTRTTTTTTTATQMDAAECWCCALPFFSGFGGWFVEAIVLGGGSNLCMEMMLYLPFKMVVPEINWTKTCVDWKLIFLKSTLVILLFIVNVSRPC